MQDLGRTKDFKHIIRPDGTIRRATKGVAKLHDDEIVVESPTLHQPGFWVYDFNAKQLAEIPQVELEDRSAQVQAARAIDAQSVATKKADLRTKIDNQPAELQSILNLMLELTGLDDV